MATEQLKEVRVYFQNNPEYKLIHATGAWGGITPQGQVLCQLFFDRRENPETVALLIEKDGEVKETSRTGEQRLIRDILVGIVLRPDHAYSIGAWLQKNAIEAGFDPEAKKPGEE